ncbi:MAG: DNA polymerase beta superfamily protein [Thermoplasmatota archaeon]
MRNRNKRSSILYEKTDSEWISMEIDEEIIDQIRKQLSEMNCEPFFLCISGSDNYGFSSENNSDVDIRGAYYFTDPNDMFSPGLERKLTREGEYTFEGMKYEWQIHEVSKFLRLMGKSNMNIYDWIHSNDIILLPPEFFGMNLEYIRDRSRDFISQNMVDHAFGWCKHMLNEDWSNPKKILHSIRPLMTCLDFIETGKYEPNIQVLVERDFLREYKPLIMELIDLKKSNLNTNVIVKERSGKCYDELKDRISGKRDRIPGPSADQVIVKALITDIRLKTLAHYRYTS